MTKNNKGKGISIISSIAIVIAAIHSLLLILVVFFLAAGLLSSRAYCAEPEPATVTDEAPAAEGYWGMYHAAPDTTFRQGVVITFILPGGPADRAGLREGDVILEINGQKTDDKTFPALVSKTKPGEKVSVTVMRAGEKIAIPLIAGEFAAEFQPKGFDRNYIEMKSLGTYIVMLPPDYGTSKKNYPLCVILHGMGSSEVYHGRLADQFGREGVIYIAPRYPYPYPETFYEDKMEGWSAYPPYDLKDEDPYYPVLDSLSANWIFSCAADAKKRYRVSGDKVFIIGHSMGAGFAIICTALHPEKVGSYFAYAPFVPDYYITPDMLKGLKKNKVKVYLAHGTRDKVLDIENSQRAEKAMKEAGVDCTFKIFDTEHMFAKEIVAFAREWIAAEVRPPK